LRVALIFPRVREQVHGMWPPLGIIALGTVLREAGHEVWLFDSSFDPGPGRVISELGRIKPHVVGVSCLTDFFMNAARIVAAAKGLGAVTLMGGPHPTILPEETLCAVPELDYAVMGEAERTLPRLLEALDGGDGVREIPGLALRDGKGVVSTGPAQPIEDLDSLPVPDRDLLDVMGQYLRARAINMHASRGCPFRCSFCQPTLERLFGRKVRFESPERVAEEIGIYHRRYDVRDFFFHDDTFTVKKSWLEGLVETLGHADLIHDFRYVVNSRVDTFDRDKARLLKEMGVYYVLFGIESGSQQVLDALNKGTTVDQAREAFRICREFGFRTHAYVLLGSPTESKDSLVATRRLVAELNPNTVHISIYTPLPGTVLAERCAREGRTRIKDFSDTDYYLKKSRSGEPPISIPGLTYQDLLDSRAAILNRRKLRVFSDNLRELARDLVREPSLDKFIFRFQSYRRMKHYFG
jgi:anaerobic magnesium-protoporphyrin IX monomethyl ester cyclase